MIDLKINKNSVLHEIGMFNSTDKAWHKRHTFLYEALFEKYGFSRNKKINLLELGFSHGFSHLMWYDYFFNSNIVGVDHWNIHEYYQDRYMPKKHVDLGYYIRKKQDGTTVNKLEYINNLIKNEERFSVYIADQSCKDLADRIVKEHGRFDIIIDDASHVGEKTRDSFNNLFDSLNPGGLYIIEDLEAWGRQKQRNVREDILNYTKNSSKFEYLNNFKNVDFVELLFSRDHIKTTENFVLGIIRKNND